MEEKKLRAAIYLRVSTAEQVDGHGIEGQLANIKRFIEVRHNLEFAGEQHIYQDLAISGAEPPSTREGFMRLVNDVRYSAEKPFDVVIVYKIDRFARRLTILLDVVEQLEEIGIGFISTQESLDTNSAFGKAMLGILGVFSELERDMILERTTMGIEQGLQSGSWYRLRRYGYTKSNETGEVKIVPEEADIVKQIFEMFVYDRKTVGEICKYLTDKKVKNPSTSMANYGGKKSKRGPYNWEDKTIRQFLREDLYIGKYYYFKEKSVKIDKAKNKSKTIKLPREEWKLSTVTHQPIIPDDLFEKAQDILDAKAGNHNYDNAYILSGLLRCDCCKGDKQRGMSSRVGQSSHGTRGYVCRGREAKRYGSSCPTTTMRADHLENLIVKEIKNLIRNPDRLVKAIKKSESLLTHKQMIERRMEQTGVKLTNMLAKINNNKELRSDGDIDKKTFEDRMKKLEEQKDILIEEQRKLHNAFADYFDIEAQQKALEFLNKISFNLDTIFSDSIKCRKLLNLLIEEIVVYSKVDNEVNLPGRKKVTDRYVPDTLMIKFKLPQDFLDSLYGIDDGPKDPSINGNSLGRLSIGKPSYSQKIPDAKKRGRPKSIRNALTEGIIDYEKYYEIINMNIPHSLSSVPIIQLKSP